MLLIFDYDGVLRSASWEGMLLAYRAIAKETGNQEFEFLKDQGTFKKWFNPDWRINLNQMGITDPALFEKDNILFHQVYDPHVRVFPWVKEIILKLFERHLLALLSASAEHSVRDSLGETADHFDLIVGCEKVIKLKPDPEGINFILGIYPEIPKSLVWIIGDSVVDIQAGKAADIKTCAVTWGLDSYQQLVETKPDLLIDQPEDLLNL